MNHEVSSCRSKIPKYFLVAMLLFKVCAPLGAHGSDVFGTASVEGLADQFALTILKEIYSMDVELPQEMQADRAYRQQPRRHLIGALYENVSFLMSAAPPEMLIVFQRRIFEVCRKFGYYAESDLEKYGFKPQKSLRVKSSWIERELRHLEQTVLNPPKGYRILAIRYDRHLFSVAALRESGDLELDSPSYGQSILHSWDFVSRRCKKWLEP